jgi:hypothetical protein
MAQQTAAVDWIIQQLPPNYRKNAGWYKIFKQAKEMFQQQIVKAHREQSYLQDDGSWLELTGEQYYTKTYAK